MPFFGRGWIDREAHIRCDLRFVAAFTNSRLTIQEIWWRKTTWLMVRVIGRGVHAGAIDEVPEPTLRPFEVEGLGVDRFRNRRTVEHVPWDDPFGRFDQSGVSSRRSREA